VLDLPPLTYLMIDGSGHPEEEGFQQAAGALYPLAYYLKFMTRDRLGIDYRVMPMEVRWKPDRVNKGRFAWTMLLLQPDWITEGLLAQGLLAEARDRSIDKADPESLARVRLETTLPPEGARCGQILHAGPYDGMNATLARMTAQLAEQGYAAGQDTHDIYLNDMRRTKPENLKAIMRVDVHPLV